MDISLKIGIGLAVATAGGAAVILPNGRQKDEAAMDLFDKPWSLLNPEEERVAEFSAGYRRWNTFIEKSVYSWTRKLPGANNPIRNPYNKPKQPLQAPPPEAEATTGAPPTGASVGSGDALQ